LITDSPTNTTLVLLSQYCNSGNVLNTWNNQTGIQAGLFNSIQFNSIYFVHLIQKGIVTHRI